jgi:hypothetical protein
VPGATSVIGWSVEVEEQVALGVGHHQRVLLDARGLRLAVEEQVRPVDAEHQHRLVVGDLGRPATQRSTSCWS